MTDNPITRGRLLEDGEPVADVAAIRWTVVDGKPIAWTGWLTLAEGAKPLAAGRFTLQLADGAAGSVPLMAEAAACKPAPFCNAPPAPRCKPAGR
jgi:hypothetical protein